MSKTAITIDRTKETITLTRSFQIAAGNIASAEYREYLRLKEQYPNFSIIVQQKQRKKADDIFGKLTYEKTPRGNCEAVWVKKFCKTNPMQRNGMLSLGDFTQSALNLDNSIGRETQTLEREAFQRGKTIHCSDKPS